MAHSDTNTCMNVDDQWSMTVQAALVAVGTSLLFLTLYSGTAYLTSFRSDVGTWYYDWERFIPFVPVMIVPYMSIDLFFFLAPFLCRDRKELRVLAWRLSAVIVVSAVCFLIYPLRLAVERPVADGMFGTIYNWFTAIDRPYNLCPSMHIALRTVLAAHYARYCRGWLRAGLHFWFFLIGCSTLLLYQHHVIDVIGGFVLGVLVMYALDGQPWRLPKSDGSRYAVMYGLVSIVLALPVVAGSKLGWFTGWPAVSCGLIAFGYAWAGPAVFRRRNGRLSWPARWVLGPVLAAQWLSWKYYGRQSNKMDHVCDGVWIGRRLTQGEAGEVVGSEINSVVDLCNAFDEAPAFRDVDCLELPVLDLTAPTAEQLERSTAYIEAHRQEGVLVHCKAGYSRSAAVVATWLVATNRAASFPEAFAKLTQARPEIVIRPEIAEAEAYSRFELAKA